MKLQLSRNSYSCLLACAGMCLNVDQDALAAEIGHDGSDIWWPSLVDPYNRRGFHIQEIIDCAWARGYSILEINAIPQCRPCASAEVRNVPVPDTRFMDYLHERVAILGGTLPNGCGHACAWDGQLVYDPRGNITTAEGLDMPIHTAYIFVDLLNPKINTHDCLQQRF